MNPKTILGFRTYAVPDHHPKSQGKNTIITEFGKNTLVHLDNPDDTTIANRIRENLREQENEEAFFDDCPLCQEMRNQPHNIVYFNQNLDTEA